MLCVTKKLQDVLFKQVQNLYCILHETTVKCLFVFNVLETETKSKVKVTFKTLLTKFNYF
jgi:hypothetical protein